MFIHTLGSSFICRLLQLLLTCTHNYLRLISCTITFCNHHHNWNMCVILTPPCLQRSKSIFSSPFSLASKTRLLSVSASHAAAWLSVISSTGLGLHLEPNKFHTALRWWLGLDTSNWTMCPFCPDIALDSLGHHAVTCKHGGDLIICHNHLHIVVTNFYRRAHLSEMGHGLTGP